MMGFVRYRSTGDMLAADCEPAGKAHKKRLPELEPEPQDGKPLFVHEEQGERWNSCKFLGNESLANDRRQQADQRPEKSSGRLVAPPADEQWHSVTDFLVFSIRPKSDAKAKVTRPADKVSYDSWSSAKTRTPTTKRVALGRRAGAGSVEARRRRVSKVRLSNLSSSSPSLSNERQWQRDRQRAGTELEPQLASYHHHHHHHHQQQQQPRQVNTQRTIGASLHNGTRQQQVADSARTSETKANDGDEDCARLHCCRIDFEQLQLQVQSARLTNGVSSCYSTGGWDASNSNPVPSLKRQPKSPQSKCANDNGIESSLDGEAAEQFYSTQQRQLAAGKNQLAHQEHCLQAQQISPTPTEGFNFEPRQAQGASGSRAPAAAADVGTNGQETKATNPLIASKIMVDLNSTANKLMGSCCNSWRHALHPNNSGSYKVAQLQAAAMSGSEWLKQETGANQQQRDQRVARISRPGRSPLSIQRQTNARLVRHRLKLQQQRQEQLAQLALRERQQLLNNHQPNRQPDQISARYQLSAPLQPLQPAAPVAQNQPLLLIESLIDRLTFGRQTASQSSSRRGSAAQAPTEQHSPARELSLSIGDGRQQQQRQQQLIQPATIRAIEICDSQPACSSRQEQQHPLIRNTGHTSSQHRPNNGNVIVFESANMLRNEMLSSSHHDRHMLAGSRRGAEYPEESEAIRCEDTQTISSSSSTLSLNRPFCKICHIGNTKNNDKLISPCRCSGTMQYIHCGCLLKWLEISNRTNEKPMSCELCAHEYIWHKKFNYANMQFPKCSLKDVFLHLIFVAAIFIMLLSATAPMAFRSKSHDSETMVTTHATSTEQPPTNSYKMASLGIAESHRQHRPFYHHDTGFSGVQPGTSRLAHDEKFMLLCAASFFISFFCAIYVQTKARDTLYGLLVKFLHMNQTYYITEYDHGNNSCNNGNSGPNSKQQCSRVDRKSSQKS